MDHDTGEVIGGIAVFILLVVILIGGVGALLAVPMPWYGYFLAVGFGGIILVAVAAGLTS